MAAKVSDLLLITFRALDLEIGGIIRKESLTTFFKTKTISVPLISYLACKREHGEKTYEERITVKILKENGHSFPQIAKVVGCHYSACIRIFHSFKKIGSTHQKQRTGRPEKINERCERFVCRVARMQRFGKLKAIANEVATCFPTKNPSSALVRHILHKYKIKCYERKRKPFVNLRQRCYCVQWSRILCHWTADQWKDVIFSDECRIWIKN